MAPFAPFERPPTLAVATSGGGDSLALCLLAAEWAAERGGAAFSLIVDHGLRPESRAEADGVAARLAGTGICAVVLPWLDRKPATGIQAAARVARYRLLMAWCRDHRVLHLLLGHQRDDQIETFVMRRRRRSGPIGLAAMRPVVERDHVRILRPCLALPGARLRATLRARGWTWVEDPSNQDPRFERVRVRRELAASPDATLPASVAAAERARHALCADVTALLAANARFDPAGCVSLTALWRYADAATREATLRRVLMAVGGRDRPPGPAALARLDRGMNRDGAWTLAGCLIQSRGGRAVIRREARPRAPLAAGSLAGHRSVHHVQNGQSRVTLAAAGGHAKMLATSNL
ncbi:MAG: tRNA lysidine(34) synthetase TilS [Alphaproteobacteria bacterium]|nr:tRNA lysidine(34) synthetase TilS [Alphaproteobacteria bacterium]